MWACECVVQVAEEVSREGEVTSLNPADREFCTKNVAICDFNGDRRALASGLLPRLKKIQVFSHFFISRFAERRALGKGFAKCPINGSRQRSLCRGRFAESYARQRLCRGP
jgi:hypothetical protein